MTYDILYSYLRDNGRVVNSTEIPNGRDFTIRYRIYADQGKMLTFEGKALIGGIEVLDVDDMTGYGDIDNPFYIPVEEEE